MILGCSSNKISELIKTFFAHIDVLDNHEEFEKLVPTRSYCQKLPIYAKALNVIFLRKKITGMITTKITYAKIILNLEKNYFPYFQKFYLTSTDPDP